MISHVNCYYLRKIWLTSRGVVSPTKIFGIVNSSLVRRVSHAVTVGRQMFHSIVVCYVGSTSAMNILPAVYISRSLVPATRHRTGH